MVIWGSTVEWKHSWGHLQRESSEKYWRAEIWLVCEKWLKTPFGSGIPQAHAQNSNPSFTWRHYSNYDVTYHSSDVINQFWLQVVQIESSLQYMTRSTATEIHVTTTTSEKFIRQN